MRRVIPEIRLVSNLARCHVGDLRAVLTDEIRRVAWNWDQLIGLATARAVLPLVHATLSQLEPGVVPAGVESTLRDLRARSVARDLAGYHQWMRLCNAFAAEGIAAITVRGFHAAMTVFGELGLRPVDRLEFVVRDADVERAGRVLEKLALSVPERLRPVSDLPSSEQLAEDLFATAVPFALPNATETLVLAPELSLVLLLLDSAREDAPSLLDLIEVDEAWARLSDGQRASVSTMLEALGQPGALRRSQELLASHREPQVFSTAAVRRKVSGEVGAACTFVTAIYDSGAESLIGGRGRGLDHYLASLANIANLGAALVVYCPPKDVERVTQRLAAHFSDLCVLPYDLEQFPGHAKFLEWKRSYVDGLAINNRNELLCFLKSYWVQDAIGRNPFGHGHFYWIDAGLTHHGIFPESLGGVELFRSHPESRYHPEDRKNIFRPELAQALLRATPADRVFFCALPVRFSTAPHEEVTAAHYGLPLDDVKVRHHLVGGLFGGTPDALGAVHRHFTALLTALIEQRVYTLEEQVFSSVHAVHPELFALQLFGTWWFHAPGQANSQLAEEGDSFYKVFTRLLEAASAQ